MNRDGALAQKRTRWRVRRQRAILGPKGKTLFGPGTVIDDLEKVPLEQHDKLVVFEEEVAVEPEPEPEEKEPEAWESGT